MTASRTLAFLFFVSNLIWCPNLWAQQAPAPPNQSGAGYFDLGLKTGSFLPSKIEGVRELLPIFGVKLGHSVSKTLAIEYDFDAALAKGVSYYLTYISLRHDFNVGDAVPLFFLLGVDGHYYKRADSYGEITGNRTEYDFRFTTGWHTGFGSETLVYGDIYIRGDVRMGFSPGRTLTVAISGIYRY